MNPETEKSCWEYTLTKEDHFHGMLFQMLKTDKFPYRFMMDYPWIVRLITLTNWVLLAILIYLIFTNKIKVEAIFGMSLIVVIIGLFSYKFRIAKCAINCLPRKDGFFVGKFKVIVENGSLGTQGPGYSHSIKLKALMKTFMSEKYIFIYFDSNHLQLIPKRDIGGDEACNKLLDALSTSRSA